MIDRRREEGCAILLSTHNLQEAERQADRVAVLNQRLIICDTPAHLRQGLGPARVVVRVAGSAKPYLQTARHIDGDATADEGLLRSRSIGRMNRQPGWWRPWFGPGPPSKKCGPSCRLSRTST